MKIALFFIVFATYSVFGQDRIEKKLEKELGQDLIQINPDYSKGIDVAEIDTIWSRTVDSVITGYAFKGEFISLPDTSEHRSILYPTYITEEAISKSDFLQFRQWVLDSTARFHCYFGMGDFGLEWLMIPPGLDSYQYRPEAPEFSDKQAIVQLFPLDWDYKFYYDDPSLIPLLNDLYLTPAERFRRQKSIDYRKSFYLYGKPVKGNLEKVPILIDSYSWIKQSEPNFGRTAVLSMLDEKLYLNTPVTHIEPFMATAYCHWKTKQSNKELKRKGYRVEIRIPTAKELEGMEAKMTRSLQISAYNPTENWKITNNEYREFCQYALDSLSKEYLYGMAEDGEIALQLIEYSNYYYSEPDYEYVDLDPDNRIETRQNFNLNPDPIDWEDFGYQNQMEMVKEIDLDSVPFRYEWMDAKSRGLDPEKLRIGGMLNGVKGFGTCDFGNITPYIKKETVFISQPSWLPKNDSIADITYVQALAYYNWKFRIDQFVNEKASGNWQQYVFPSKEEFDRIKNGETIILPSQEIEYQSPVFRTVVELVPED